MYKQIRALILFCLFNLIGLVDWLLPKDKNLVLFGQKRGGYGGNSRALFEYVKRNSSLKAVWLTSRKDLIDGVNYFSPYSWKGLILALRASILVVSHGAGDIPYSGYFSKRKKYLVVWHGIPLKRIALLDANLNDEKEIKAVEREISKYTHYIAASESEAEMLVKCRKLESADVIHITGLPRNDALLTRKSGVEANVAKSIQNILDSKIILYAPTFRDKSDTKFFPFKDVCFDSLYSKLEALQAYLFFRPHPNDQKNIEFLRSVCKQYGNRFVLADNNLIPDVAEILPFVDTVITDYSSIYIDLLLTNCSYLFIPYDLEDYHRERGLLYDYGKVTPGPKLGSQEELLSGLERGLTDPSFYLMEREKVKRLFHFHHDNKSTERVCQLLERIADRNE